MGEAFAGKTVGKKAMLWGAMAQSIPDIDFLAAFWLDTTSNLLAHRGFTHSFLFCAIITPLFALLAEKLHRPHNIRFLLWLLFFGSVIFIHIFIDAFNNYGVGWFEPFSHKRISFNAIYVADPFFSIWPGIAAVARPDGADHGAKPRRGRQAAKQPRPQIKHSPPETAGFFVRQRYLISVCHTGNSPAKWQAEA